MTEYESIRAPADAIEAARDAKRDGETWGEYLLRCADVDVPQKWTEAEIRDIVTAEVDRSIQELTRGR